MLLYILLAIIAIGVLLASEPGRALLAIILLIIVACFVLYIGFYFILFLLTFFFEYKSKLPSIFTTNSEYDWIPGAIIGVALLGGSIYATLFPFGYDKNRQIWTGKKKIIKSNEFKTEESENGN